MLRICLIALSLFVSTGANYQTPNFHVTAATDEIAERVGTAAEEYRRDLAVFWLDEPLPNWSRPCKLRVRAGSMGAGGETRFQFVGGEVINWDMYVQGSMERIIDSVLPHEINHTIFACHFRRPLPRWADEGAATLFEHRSEQVKQLGLLNQVINSKREFIELDKLLLMKEYPKGYRPMLIMYAEGYALADFLVQQGGRKRYLKFLADGEQMGWTQAIDLNYEHVGVESLQQHWRGWILAGMPKLNLPKGQMLASVSSARESDLPRPAILDEYATDTTVRSQSPETGRTAPSSSPGRRVARTSGSDHQRIAAATTGGHSLSPARSRTSLSSAPAAADMTESDSASSVFYGLPTESDDIQGNPRRRAASLAAPMPRHSGKASVPSSSRNSPDESAPSPGRTSDPTEQQSSTPGSAAARRRENFEATGTGLRSVRNGASSNNRPLPQERSVLTGSVPQWAGFPGQKELF